MGAADLIKEALRGFEPWQVTETPLGNGVFRLDIWTRRKISDDHRSKIESVVRVCTVITHRLIFAWTHDRTPDPFGDAVREAQAKEGVSPVVIPHPVTRPETEAEKDALWKSIEDYGRGG